MPPDAAGDRRLIRCPHVDHRACHCRRACAARAGAPSGTGAGRGSGWRSRLRPAAAGLAGPALGDSAAHRALAPADRDARPARRSGVPVRIGSIAASQRRLGRRRSSCATWCCSTRSGARRCGCRACGGALAALAAASAGSVELRLAQLLIDGARLEVRRDAAGPPVRRRAGLSAARRRATASGAADWFFRQHEFVDPRRHAALDRRAARRAAAGASDVDWWCATRCCATAAPGRHAAGRLGRALQPARRVHPAAARAQPATGSAGAGSVYADLPRADLRQLRRYVDLPFELSEGVGALRAWLDLRDGQAARR